jgi:hypothetical protein
MAVEATAVAEAIVGEVAASAGDGEVAVDVGGWGAEALRALLDALLASPRCRLKGVRADAASFAKLGLPREVPGSGRYAGVPVVMTDLDPDTLVFAFAPRRP